MEVTCRFDETKYVLKVFNNCVGEGPPLLAPRAESYMNSMNGSEAERLLLTLEHFGSLETTIEVEGDNSFHLPCYKYCEFGVCLCPIECADYF